MQANATQLTIRCSKLTIETMEKGAEYVQSNNEHVSHLVLPFLLITLSRKMRAGLAVHEAPKTGNHINIRPFVK